MRKVLLSVVLALLAGLCALGLVACGDTPTTPSSGTPSSASAAKTKMEGKGYTVVVATDEDLASMGSTVVEAIYASKGNDNINVTWFNSEASAKNYYTQYAGLIAGGKEAGYKGNIVYMGTKQACIDFGIQFAAPEQNPGGDQTPNEVPTTYEGIRKILEPKGYMVVQMPADSLEGGATAGVVAIKGDEMVSFAWYDTVEHATEDYNVSKEMEQLGLMKVGQIGKMVYVATLQGYADLTNTPVENPGTGGSEGENPGTGTEQPGTGTEQPGTGTENPGEDEKPGESENPGTGTDSSSLENFKNVQEYLNIEGYTVQVIDESTFPEQNGMKVLYVLFAMRVDGEAINNITILWVNSEKAAQVLYNEFLGEEDTEAAGISGTIVCFGSHADVKAFIYEFKGEMDEGAGSENPGTGTENPGEGENPGTGTENPGTGGNESENPGTGTENPGTGTEQPGTGTENLDRYEEISNYLKGNGYYVQVLDISDWQVTNGMKVEYAVLAVVLLDEENSEGVAVYWTNSEVLAQALYEDYLMNGFEGDSAGYCGTIFCYGTTKDVNAFVKYFGGVASEVPPSEPVDVEQIAGLVLQGMTEIGYTYNQLAEDNLPEYALLGVRFENGEEFANAWVFATPDAARAYYENEANFPGFEGATVSCIENFVAYGTSTASQDLENVLMDVFGYQKPSEGENPGEGQQPVESQELQAFANNMAELGYEVMDMPESMLQQSTPNAIAAVVAYTDGENIACVLYATEELAAADYELMSGSAPEDQLFLLQGKTIITGTPKAMADYKGEEYVPPVNPGEGENPGEDTNNPGQGGDEEVVAIPADKNFIISTLEKLGYTINQWAEEDIADAAPSKNAIDAITAEKGLGEMIVFIWFETATEAQADFEIMLQEEDLTGVGIQVTENMLFYGTANEYSEFVGLFTGESAPAMPNIEGFAEFYAFLEKLGLSTSFATAENMYGAPEGAMAAVMGSTVTANGDLQIMGQAMWFETAEQATAAYNQYTQMLQGYYFGVKGNVLYLSNHAETFAQIAEYFGA